MFNVKCKFKDQLCKRLTLILLHVKSHETSRLLHCVVAQGFEPGQFRWFHKLGLSLGPDVRTYQRTWSEVSECIVALCCTSAVFTTPFCCFDVYLCNSTLDCFDWLNFLCARATLVLCVMLWQWRNKINVFEKCSARLTLSALVFVFLFFKWSEVNG